MINQSNIACMEPPIQIEQTTSVKARIVNVYRTRVLFISMQVYAKNVPSIYHNVYAVYVYK